MGRARALTKAQEARLVAAHERGVTYPTLAARYGVSVRTVRRYVHNARKEAVLALQAEGD